MTSEAAAVSAPAPAAPSPAIVASAPPAAKVATAAAPPPPAAPAAPAAPASPPPVQVDAKAQAAASAADAALGVKTADAPTKADAPAAEKDLWSPRFVALARKERATLQREAELKAKESELQTRTERYVKAAELDAAGDTIGAMQALGWIDDKGEKFTKVMEDLTHYTLKGKAMDPEVRTLKQAVMTLQQQLTQEAQSKVVSKQQSEQQSQEAAIAWHKGNIAQHLQSIPDRSTVIVEIAQELGKPHPVELINDTCKEYFNRTGELLNVAKATEMVETKLIELGAQSVSKLSRYDKLRPKTETAVKGDVKSEVAAARQAFGAAFERNKSEKPKQATSGAQTINNAQAQAPQRPPADNDDSPDACRRRALAMMG